MSNLANETVIYPFTAFNFAVEIEVDGVSPKVCNASFAECDGLDMTMEVKTIREGGNNGRQIRLTGPVSYGQLTLKRGMTETFDLWDWFSAMLKPGILAAWLWQRHGPGLRVRLAGSRSLSSGGADLALLVVLVTLAYLLLWSTFRGFMSLEVTGEYLWHVPEGVLWTMVLLLVVLFPLRSRVLIVNPLAARLGVLSYSIYVLHQPVLEYTLQPWRARLPQAGLGWDPLIACWFVLAAATCLGLAVVTYRVIERPFLVRKARLDTPAATPDRGSSRTVANDGPPASQAVR